MAAIKGSVVSIKKGDGGDPEAFTTVASARNISFEYQESTADTTSQDDYDATSGVQSTSDMPGSQTVTASAEIVIKTAAAYEALVDDKQAGTVRNYQIDIGGIGTHEGAFRIASLSMAAPLDNVLTANITLRGQGLVTFTAA